MTLKNCFTLSKKFYKEYIVPLAIKIREYEFPAWKEISFSFVIGFSTAVVVGAIIAGISLYYLLYFLFFTGYAIVSAPLLFFLISYMLYRLGSSDSITDEFDKIMFCFVSFLSMAVAVIIILIGLFG